MDGNGMLLSHLEQLITSTLQDSTMEERYKARQSPIELTIEYYSGVKFVITGARVEDSKLILTLELAF